MPTPSKTGWSRLDMCLWELCTTPYSPITDRRFDIREETEDEWQRWINKRVDRAERNLQSRHAVGSERNQELRRFTYDQVGLIGHGDAGPPSYDELEPYGSHTDDYEWSVFDDDDCEEGAPPIEERTHYHQWFLQRIARANRNRDDHRKPTASRASDDVLDHHGMDYDIWMDSQIQQEHEYPLVRDYLESDNSDIPCQQEPEERHHAWFNPPRAFIPVTGQETEDHQGKILEMVVSQLTDMDGCPICKRGVFDKPCQTRCFHVFCRECLDDWLEQSRTCPNCRTYVGGAKPEMLDDQIPRPKKAEDDDSAEKANLG